MRDRFIAAGPSLLVLAYSDNILVVNTASASITVLASPIPPKSAVARKEGEAKGIGQVEAVAVSPDGTLVAALYLNKMVALWKTSTGELLAQRILPKKAVALIFGDQINGRQVILVSDKIGDVRAYPADKNLTKESALLLGHTASVGTCLDLKDGILASADRDEKIRLSCYPCTLIIKSYLTGHESFISVIRLLSGNRALSASGDGSLAMWDTDKGQDIVERSIRKDVQAILGHSIGEKEGEGRATSKEEKEKEENGQSEQEEEQEKIGTNLAVNTDESLMVVIALNFFKLLIYSLPDVQLHQALDLPALSLGVVFAAEEKDLIYVSVEAPIYLLAYRVSEKNKQQVELVEDDPVVEAVTKHCKAQGLKTEVVVDEAFMDAMKKENLQLRHEWNDKKRREEHVEKRKLKKRKIKDVRSANGGDNTITKESSSSTKEIA